MVMIGGESVCIGLIPICRIVVVAVAVVVVGGSEVSQSSESKQTRECRSSN